MLADGLRGRPSVRRRVGSAPGPRPTAGHSTTGLTQPIPRTSRVRRRSPWSAVPTAGLSTATCGRCGPPVRMDVDSQAENASSTLVTRSITKAQVSPGFGPLGLRRVRDQNGGRDLGVTLRIGRPAGAGRNASTCTSRRTGPAVEQPGSRRAHGSVAARVTGAQARSRRLRPTFSKSMSASTCAPPPSRWATTPRPKDE